MSGLNGKNTQVAKTIKLFIGGDFPRTESGRSFTVAMHGTKNVYANLCLGSRKDFRNAVTAAQGALHSWSGKSAFNRGQILYRMAEMTEGKREEFIETLVATLGYTRAKASSAVDAAVDAFVYYAGWADKYQQVIGAVNPVSGPHHNFTTAEPVGIVGFIANEKFDLGRLVAQLAAILASGNTIVALLATQGAAVIAPLSEVLATSDLPKGVVNLLTGDLAELSAQFGTHMELHSLSVQTAQPKILADLKKAAAANMKRVVPPSPAAKTALSLDQVLSFVEYKTVWHPIGN